MRTAKSEKSTFLYYFSCRFNIRFTAVKQLPGTDWHVSWLCTNCVSLQTLLTQISKYKKICEPLNQKNPLFRIILAADLISDLQQLSGYRERIGMYSGCEQTKFRSKLC